MTTSQHELEQLKLAITRADVAISHAENCIDAMKDGQEARRKELARQEARLAVPIEHWCPICGRDKDAEIERLRKALASIAVGHLGHYQTHVANNALKPK